MTVAVSSQMSKNEDKGINSAVSIETGGDEPISSRDKKFSANIQQCFPHIKKSVSNKIFRSMYNKKQKTLP